MALRKMGIILASALLGSAGAGFGAPVVWTGNGANSSWSTAQNWNPAAVPANDGTASVTIGAGGITDQGFSAETFQTPIVLGADQAWTVSANFNSFSAALLVPGTVNTNGHGLTIAGSSGLAIVALQGIVSGTGGLSVNIGSDMIASSFVTNSYSGGTTLNGGTFEVNTDLNLGQAGAPIVFNGGTLRIENVTTINRDITISSGGGEIYADLGQFQTVTIPSSIHGTGTLETSIVEAN
jgi:fibronectin-binding autotransporter adhesin